MINAISTTIGSSFASVELDPAEVGRVSAPVKSGLVDVHDALRFEQSLTTASGLQQVVPATTPTDYVVNKLSDTVGTIQNQSGKISQSIEELSSTQDLTKLLKLQMQLEASSLTVQLAAKLTSECTKHLNTMIHQQ